MVNHKKKHVVWDKSGREIELADGDIAKLRAKVESAVNKKYDFPGRIEARHLWDNRFRVLWWITGGVIANSKFIVVTGTTDEITIEERK